MKKNQIEKENLNVDNKKGLDRFEIYFSCKNNLSYLNICEMLSAIPKKGNLRKYQKKKIMYYFVLFLGARKILPNTIPKNSERVEKMLD